MNRKTGNVRCQRCGAWFNPRTYLAVLIEGKNLCRACAKSEGLWSPISKRVIRKPKIKSGGGRRESSEPIDSFEGELLKSTTFETQVPLQNC